MLLAQVLAGELVVETEVPIDLTIDGRPSAKLYGASTLTLELPDGEHVLYVYRGEGKETLKVLIGEQTTRVRVGSSLLEASASPPKAPTDATTGQVEVRMVNGPGATIIWDGARHPVSRDGTLRLPDLAPGQYTIEARSADMTYVWLRGTVTVEAGDEVVLALSEGRPAECYGRPEAWQPDR